MVAHTNDIAGVGNAAVQHLLIQHATMLIQHRTMLPRITNQRFESSVMLSNSTSSTFPRAATGAVRSMTALRTELSRRGWD